MGTIHLSSPSFQQPAPAPSYGLEDTLMCGRFTLKTPNDELVRFFQLTRQPDWSPRYNIAPSQPVIGVRQTDGGRSPSLLTWGLIPAWSRDPAIGSRLINARSESLAQKPAFRAAFRSRRCLILADGFYEWKKVSGKLKQPMYIHMVDQNAFAFAGLWEQWTAADGSEIESCTIVTTEPNERLAEVHNRMPAILPPETYDVWLDPDQQDSATLQPLLKPYPSDALAWRAVSTVVNNPRNDVPECVVAVREESGGGLFR